LKNHKKRLYWHDQNFLKISPSRTGDPPGEIGFEMTSQLSPSTLMSLRPFGKAPYGSSLEAKG
jgi:hypothetical protein